VPANRSSQAYVIAEGKNPDSRTSGYSSETRKLEKAMRAEKPVHLYWVTVPDDPSEDWFVFATQAHLARAFFEDYEGFESREAEVRLVKRDVRLNKFELGERPCWAQLSDLEAIGFDILSRTPNFRSVSNGTETFVEGYLQSEIVQTRDNLSEARGRGRPHGTRRQGKPN
jgi:hypothetical protein